MKMNYMKKCNVMTKGDLLNNKDFMEAPMDAVIEIPNAHYGLEGDEREEVYLSKVQYWKTYNQINLW